MRQDEQLETTQPALMVTYGHTPKRCRPLDKDVLLLGRSPFCDLVLSSPEVAAVHCVLARGADGWRVRDCGGRAGTRVNGESAQDEPLRDGDTLQVGAFCFEVRLPPAPEVKRPAASADVALGDTTWFEARQAELERKAERLQALESDLEGRLRQLRREQEELARKRAETPPPPPAAPAAPAPPAADSGLERRAAELNHFARHLRRQRQRLDEERVERVRRAAGGAERAEALRQENERLRRSLEDQEREGAWMSERLEELTAQAEELQRTVTANAEAEAEALREELRRRDARVAELEAALRDAELRLASETPRRPTSESWPDTKLSDKLAWVRQLKEELARRRSGAH
jgi:hypothetical protein